MTDILIPLGKGSRHQDIELRYCLRSIEKHLSGVGNVWIVGELPAWVKGVVHVPFQDNTNNWNRARNIYSKIIAGIQAEIKGEWIDNYGWPITKLSDNFLFMNDDHYLLQDYNAAEFPYYHRGVADLRNMQHNPPQLSQYGRTACSLGSRFLDFGVHCPIVYNKQVFKDTFKNEVWREHGFEIKSMYGNRICTSGVYMDDLKFSQPALPETIYRLLEDRPWFSVGDRALKGGGMLQVLSELYPNKSKYEL